MNDHANASASAKASLDFSFEKATDFVIKEVFFKKDEHITLENDVYNLTIGAIITQNVRPASLIFAIRYCFMVFII